MAEVVANLQNLTGSTIGEIFRTLNLLIKQHGDEIKHNLDYILTNFEADNHLKQLAKIRFIDQYQCYDEMLNVLKSDNVFYISHVLQCSWFFKNSSFDPIFLVNSVFPLMSYSTRTKILKKYSKFLKDTSVAETLFEVMKNRYGINAAISLLPACSENFIKQILENISVQIPVYILIPIFKSYPSLVITYITYLLECHSKRKRVIRTFGLHPYEQLFKLIASKEPEKFGQLLEKYPNHLPYVKLGKRSTRRLLQSSYESVKSNINVYQRVIVWKNVTTHLNLDQISNLQLAAFPKSASEFIQTFYGFNDLMNVISHIKNVNVKKNLLANNFQKAYGKPITDYFNSVPFDLVCEFPRDITEKWVELKLSGVEDHNIRGNYAVYLPVEKSIPQIKKMIETQADSNIRTHLIQCLFQILKVNDDPNLVEPLCAYIVKRFRNDRAQVKETVIQALNDYNKIMKIPEEAWNPIEELLNIVLISDEVSSFPTHFISLIEKQIHYRLKRGLPVKEHMGKLLKVNYSFYKFDLCLDTPYEKQCLEWFIDWFPEKKVDKSNTKTTELDTLISRLFSWNIKHPNDKIEIPQWINEQIDNIFVEEDNYAYRKTQILKVIKKDKNLLRSFYDKLYPNFIDPQILMYKLRSEPVSIKNYLIYILNKLISQSLDSYKLFFNQVRLYNFIGIPELFCELSLNVLHEKKDEYNTHRNKRNAIMILSLMLPTNKYVELITNYYPQQNQIEDFSDEGREMLEIQSEIALSLKAINNPSDIVESLKKFAVGDYLKLIVGTLYSVFLRTSENKILPILNTWLDSPVSVRKHFIRAILRIAPIQSTLEIMLGLFEKEKNTAIRLLLLQNSLKFFHSEPCSETFSVLKAVIDQLKPSDEDAFDKLFDIEKVPDEFLSEYFKLLWNKSSIKRKTLISKNKNKIINLIEPSMFQFLAEEFYDDLVNHTFNQDTIFPIELQLFLVRYLINSKDEEQRNRRLEKIIPEIKKVFEQWDTSNLYKDHVFIYRNSLSNLIDSLIRESLDSSNKSFQILSPLDLFVKFNSILLSITKEEDILEEILLLEISSFFLSSPGNSEMFSPDILDHFSKFLESIIGKLITVYGNAIVNTISSVISKVFNWIYSDAANKLLILSEILLKNKSVHFQLLGIKLLPTNITENVERYEKLIKCILKISDVSVKPFINSLFKEFNSSVRVD